MRFGRSVVCAATVTVLLLVSTPGGVASHNNDTPPPETWDGTLELGKSTVLQPGECSPPDACSLLVKGACDAWDACPLLEGIAYENIRVGPTLEGENSPVEYVALDIYNTIPTAWWRVCAYDENHALLEDECDETELATYRLEGETIPPETEYVRLILRNSVDVDWWFRLFV